MEFFITCIYIRRDFCSGQIQKANILKIVAISWGGAVQLSSKARAHSSLINDRKSDHKVRRVSRIYEISLYHLTRPKMVLTVSVCRVSTVVYTHKILWLETLLLNNGEIYNVCVLHWSSSFFTRGCLYCSLNISTRERF